MSDYSTFSSSYGSNSDKRKQEQVLQNLKGQLALANAQEIVQRMTDKCFKKCVYYPGTSFDSGQQRCVSNCMDRYMEAFNIVSQTYSRRLQQDSNMGRR